MKPTHGRAEGQIQGAPLKDRAFRLIAAGIVLVALLLRIYRIGEHELRFDEAFSFSMVAMPNRVARALTDVNPPLYYLLLRGWAALAGQSETALRLLSAGLGTLFVVVIIWAGREIFNPRVGLWSGAFAAVAPMHLYYSRDARAYPLLTLTLLLTYIMLWRAMKKNTWGAWALVSVCALLALYTHYFAILGLLPTAFLLLTWPENEQVRQRWLRYGGATLLIGLLFLPWVLWAFVFTPRSFEAVAWIQNRWGPNEAALAIPLSLEVLGLGDQPERIPHFALKQLAQVELFSLLRVLGVALLLLLGLCLVVPWGDGRLGVSWLGRAKTWLGMLLFFPLVALWLISFHKPIYVVGRYDMVAFPAYALLLGLALGKLQQVQKAWPVLASIVALGLMFPIGTRLAPLYQAPSDRSAQATATFLHTSVENGDVVVFTGWRHLTALYYLHRLGYRWEEGDCQNRGAGRRFSCRFFPPEYEQPYFRLAANPNRASSSASTIQEYLQDYFTLLLSRADRLWVVLEAKRGLSSNDDRLLRALTRRGHRLVPEAGAPGIVRFRRSE